MATALAAASPKHHVDALILKGGGVKGLAFAGALEVLDRYYEFNTYVGASAGAIVATLLASGYRSRDLMTLLVNTDFTRFMDTPRFLVPVNLLFRFWMHSGDAFREWMREQLDARVRRAGTLRLRDLPGHVVIFAASHPEGTMVFDSRGERRDVDAAFAVRCSMSIPVFYKPARHEDRRVMDGGVLNNFPVRAFRNALPNADFIALYLGSTKAPVHRRRPLFMELLSMWLGQDELAVVDEFQEKTVVIDPSPIRTTNFAITADEKDFLVKQGRAAALRFVQRQGLVDGPGGGEVSEAVQQANEQKAVVISQRRRRHARRWLTVLALLAAVIIYMFGDALSLR